MSSPKYLYTLLCVLLIVTAASGQKAAKNPPGFDVGDFNKKFETVQWLVEYDDIAWRTTDVILNKHKDLLDKLGGEWFCFKDKAGIWHAVYGKLADGRYELVKHFTVDKAGSSSASETSPDADFMLRHARAIALGRAKLGAAIPADSPKFNQYIRENPDKTFSVWLFPAFQANGLAVYGGEAVYNIDAKGQKILTDESYFQEGFRGFKVQPPREIWLDFDEMKKPSIGAIFFAWYYKPYFTSISIDNETTTSTMLHVGDEYIWAHVVKDGRNKKKSK